MPNLTKLDKQDIIHTLNEQRTYIDSLKRLGCQSELSQSLCDNILGYNKLMMEIIDPPSRKIVKLFDRDEQ